MNFDDAIRAHSAWKTKLSAYLNNPDGSLKPEEIEPDNACALGQWIHEEGIAHSGDSDYQELKKIHANFHKAAAEVVRRADSGEAVAEDVALGATSDFAKHSSAIVSGIMKLRRKVS